MKKWFFCLSLMLYGLAAWADDANTSEAQDEFGFAMLFGVGVTFGGDNLVNTRELLTEEADNAEEFSAGGFLRLYTGIQYEFKEPSISIQGTIGYHVDNAVASIERYTISRIPIEVMLFNRIDKHYIGGGISTHLDPFFQFSSDTVNFSNAVGFILEYAYQFDATTAFNIRYSRITYELEQFNGVNIETDSSDNDVDASYFGLGATIFF